MTAYLSRFSPIPGFPSYTGPHKVGTLDVEFPVSDIEAPSAAPSESIPTIQYRIFYPCEPDAKGKTISWIPTPQRGYIGAYSRFLGAGTYLAEFISFIPRILHYISIPVIKNAPLLAPQTSNNRWPVMVFSHGLGGSRNAYSHLAGSIASHGIIVIATEHRDGSTPISYVRDVPLVDVTNEKASARRGKKTVEYRKISHTPSPEVEAQRNDQLKIRLWEMGLMHESLLQLDQDKQPPNLNTSSVSLSMFKDKMDVHTPGKIIFGGHSFGAATVVQFVKSTFYAPEASQAPKEYQSLFTPSSRSSITKQITPSTPVILLDAWCFPLRAENTRWLWNKPFPCYSQDGPGGKALLAVESQAFFKWTEHLIATKRLLSSDPSSTTDNYERPDGNGQFSQPNFYYASASAHLSQSDFGVLFPWVVKKVFAAEEPERVMRLNVRAALQLLRGLGIEVGATSAVDMEVDKETKDDMLIFGKKGEVRGWNWLDTEVEGEKDRLTTGVPDSNSAEMPEDAVVKNEVMSGDVGTKAVL